MTTSSALLHRLLARGKFRHLQVLLQLAELGSVQRTAEAIGMTQSSVTQTLAYLEQLLDTRLFDRHARGVRPTPACTDLLPVARQLMLGLNSGAEVLAARQNQGAGSVRMIGSAAAIHGLLMDALPRFSQAHPAIQVHLEEMEGEDQLLAVSRGAVDLAVCRQPAVVPQGWRFDPLREDGLVVVGRAGHPLATARRPDWADLAAQAWLLLPTGLAARRAFDDLTAHFPTPPRAHPVVTRSPPMLWWLLLRQDLLALLPLNLARPMLSTGQLVPVPVPGPTPGLAPIGILRPTDGLGAAAMQLCDFLQAAMQAPVAAAAPARRRARRASR